MKPFKVTNKEVRYDEWNRCTYESEHSIRFDTLTEAMDLVSEIIQRYGRNSNIIGYMLDVYDYTDGLKSVFTCGFGDM